IILQYAGVSSITRNGAADSVMTRAPCLDHNRARRRGDVLLFIGTHARECRFADAQFQEEISFERQSLPFGFTWSEGIAHEDVHERGWRSDGAWQPLRAASAGNESKVRLHESDQVVSILSDIKIAGE